MSLQCGMEYTIYVRNQLLVFLLDVLDKMWDKMYQIIIASELQNTENIMLLYLE